MQAVLTRGLRLAVQTSHKLVAVELKLEELGKREQERAVGHLVEWSTLHSTQLHIYTHTCICIHIQYAIL